MAAIFQWLIGLDHSVFHSINSIAGKNSFVDWVARVGADDHIIPVILALLVLSTLLIARKHSGREKAILSVICALGASALSMIILFVLNNAFFRPRPFTSQAVHLLFYHNTDSAFPSNAATLAFAMAVGIVLYWRRLGILMLVLAAYIGLARITVGIHYPLDIVGGLLLGGGSAFAVRLAEPVYAPLARWLNTGLDRLLASWKTPARAAPGKGVGS
jgi:undecaprenyl-diphosphatase